MVLATLLVPAAVLGPAWLPAARLSTATTCKSDCQTSKSTVAAAGRHSCATLDDAVTAAGRHSCATFDNAIAAAFNQARAATVRHSRSITTINDADDQADDQTIYPTGPATLDHAADTAQLPATACGAAAQYDEAGEETLARVL